MEALVGRTGIDVGRFVQICASQDDLFALDNNGDVYQYNFTTKTWIKLVPSRSCEGVLSEQARPLRRDGP